MEELIQPIEQTLIFKMTIAMGDRLIPCDVYFARMSADITFTRVIMYPDDLKAERIIDVDRDEELGWIDMYTGDASIWSEIVAAPLDYHIAQNKNAKKD